MINGCLVIGGFTEVCAQERNVSEPSATQNFFVCAATWPRVIPFYLRNTITERKDYCYEF